MQTDQFVKDLRYAAALKKEETDVHRLLDSQPEYPEPLPE
jgi:hypothetical protein